MDHYTAEVEVDRRGDLTPDQIDAAMEALGEYAPALGITPRGHQSARITFPADSIAQAASTALRVVEAAFDARTVRLDIMTEAEADAREGSAVVPELISTPEAADILHVSPQRVRQMIEEGKIGAHRVGERSFALVRSEVVARARR